MKIKIKDLAFILLPVLLWPLSFIVLKSVFIYAMLASTFLLAILSISFYRSIIPWKRLSNNLSLIAIGLVGALILSIIFFFGNFAATSLSLHGLVSNVYQMIYGSSNTILLFVTLAVIGIFEEIYWRGALQAYIERNAKGLSKIPWAATAIYYALVHVSTFNIVLVAAAAIVGLVTGILAYRYGIIPSIITHVAWIEIVVLFLPFA